MAIPEKHRTVTLSTILSLLSVLAIMVPVGRYVLTPWFVTVATGALAGEISNQVKAQTAPSNNGVKSIIADKIDQLEAERDLMLTRKERAPAKWTDIDSMQLTQTTQRLNKARLALAEFELQSNEAKRASK
jgi:hypothetical protein